MPSFEKSSKRSAAWFRAGIFAVWLLSLVLRFWGLGRFNTLVFDEVYYVKFAHNYLTQTPFFDGHPPLSKYLIAASMWIAKQLPFGHDAVNGLAGGAYAPWSYRWLNALTGSLIPPAIAGIAYQLTRRYSYALIAALFVALDGMLLVESRYALNNVYLIIFGLLGLWCFLLALSGPRSLRQELWLLLSGLSFGASAAIKWNGLWFLLGAYGLWASAWVVRSAQVFHAKQTGEPASALAETRRDDGKKSPLPQLTNLKPGQIIFYLAVVPALFYRITWIPHLRFNPDSSFWELQKQILLYHQRVGDGPRVHPYCSDWYTWLLMIRPVAYFYQVTQPGAPLPNGNSNLAATPDTVIYDVHAIGNPFLWWLSTIAIILVAGVLLLHTMSWITQKSPQVPSTISSQNSSLALTPTELWLGVFLIVNYTANLLPWVPVTRCVFLYHYMGAGIFATMAIAWLVDRWLYSTQPRLRTMGIGTIVLIALAFIFWMPIYLGLPLSPTEFQLRMWLPSWL
ncbi:dolichyl-phosphate-mannose--protein mannosyltransferase [Leptothermofonsia sp. ETS-13]|uniref:dolichyl-phosphate-mannose--protein mannosyltransferase n=1 Tax=Leptothermofonsia sp. ETS-13 TaxID=3035696 RepID=UPI003BA241E1